MHFMVNYVKEHIQSEVCHYIHTPMPTTVQLVSQLFAQDGAEALMQEDPHIAAQVCISNTMHASRAAAQVHDGDAGRTGPRGGHRVRGVRGAPGPDVLSRASVDSHFRFALRTTCSGSVRWWSGM